MHNGLTNEISFIHQEKKFGFYPLPPSQVVKDQVQMRKKIEDEKRKKKLETQEKALGKKRRGRRVFLPIKSFRKKKKKLKKYFSLNNLHASYFVNEH